MFWGKLELHGFQNRENLLLFGFRPSVATGLKIPPQAFRPQRTMDVRVNELITHAREVMATYNEDEENQSPENLAEKCVYVARLRRENYKNYVQNLNAL